MYDSSFTSSFSVRSRVAFCVISLAIMNRKEGEGIGGINKSEKGSTDPEGDTPGSRFESYVL